MAHHTEQVGYPPIPLNGNMSVRLRALSTTLDSEVAGVTCTLWALYGRDDSELPVPPDPPVEWVAIPFAN